MKSFLFVSTLFFLSSMGLGAQSKILQHEISSGWKFKQERSPNWYPATVPGVVQTDLLDNGIIEDPFFRLNERGLQWIDKEDWVYETTFDLSPDILKKNNVSLIFKGLDTYADVYLNEEKILAADNMFREWQIDVFGKLKEKENVLKIYFHSPIKVDIPKWDALPYKYEAANDQSENGGLFDKKVSIFARKAGYHYGWDWGPRLVTSGIWRPVFIEAWNDAKIEDVFIQQKEVTAKKALIRTTVEVISDKDMQGVTVRVKNDETNKLFGQVKTDLRKGLNKVDVDFTINKPQLWWSNGLGTPHLYSFKTEVVSNSNSIVDEKLNKTGIRSLKLINEPDKDGTNLYFELNGVPVFAKGANYIPNDNFLPRVSYEVYERSVLDAVNANMNMLRVWGGGIYEEDVFYELCDEHGILVWQDFMFACSMYPADKAFLESVRLEAVDNVKRLRNHPSIALWCGNNEISIAWFNWGWKKKYEEQNPEYARIIWSQYKDLFYDLLAGVVEEYAPQSYYRPSSPFSDYESGGTPNNGDSHYWSVWHGKQPISEYNNYRSRFFSEYGFQSFPEFESVKIYAPKEEDWSITSEVMMSHQRGGTYANMVINEYLVKTYKQPKDFQSFLYANQILQGDAIKTAMEAHRRDMPYCMGSLYWQHNDCWPVASWSSRDYYGRWKAQHYFAQKAYDDLLVSPIAKDGELDVYIVSDRLKQTKGKLLVRLMDLSGKELYKKEISVKVPANASKSQFKISVANLIDEFDTSKVFLNAVFTESGSNKTYANNYFFNSFKEMDLLQAKIKATTKQIENGFEVDVTSDVFARGVFFSVEGIDNFFSDNYFDLLPGETVTIAVETSLSKTEFDKQLKIVSMCDSY